MRTPFHRSAAIVALLSSLMAMSNATAADLSSEQRLKAIREAVVEAAMKSNTRVSATSWMESNGAMREMNRFSSEIKLRDLQVKEYTQAAGQEPKAELDIARVDAVQPSRCEAPLAKGSLRHAMTVGLNLSPDLMPAQRYPAQQIGFAAREQLLQQATTAQRWRLISVPVFTRAYDRATYSRGEENIQWHLQITVAPVPMGGVSDDFSGFTLQWQVTGPRRNQAFYKGQDQIIPTRMPGLVVGTPKTDSDTMDEVIRSVTAFSAKLDQLLGCDPQSFAIEKAETTVETVPSKVKGKSKAQISSSRMTISAGETAGLRVGDKLMIADASVLPRHALEPEALDAAVLAEVKSVTPYQAELKQVAGRKQTFKGAWVAWPYTY